MKWRSTPTGRQGGLWQGGRRRGKVATGKVRIGPAAGLLAGGHPCACLPADGRHVILMHPERGKLSGDKF